jgi:predicted restriction endonuclease
MIVLCPNHHLQFDRGVITVRMKGEVPIFVSRVADDPITGKLISLHPEHPLDPAYVQWHRAYFLKLPKS